MILRIGAPSSPLVSDFFTYQFDCAINNMCLKKEIVYIRYADDLTFLTEHKDILFELPALVKENLAAFIGNSIRIDRKKTKFSSKAHNRHVTGITINNDGNISLGRERKRYIKHLTFEWSNLFWCCGFFSGNSCGHYKDRKGDNGPSPIILMIYLSQISTIPEIFSVFSI